MRVAAAVAVANLGLAGVTSMEEAFATPQPTDVAAQPAHQADATLSNSQDGNGASASGTPGLELNEIIVTATRQAQNVQKVPISMAVFSEDTLRQEGVNTIDGLVRLTPGVSIARAATSPLGANITIRGISTATQSNLAGTTGIYIDDTPIQTRGLGFSAATVFPVIFDLARVEVLRGPQGTLFGAGAEGGAVRFITPEPNFSQFKGTARAELGTFTAGGDRSYEVGAAAGGPIVDDRLAFRVSAYYRRDGGYIDRFPQLANNVADRDANWDETAVARFAMTWKVSDSVEITPSLSHQRQHANGTPVYWEAQSNPGADYFANGFKSIEGFTDRFDLPALKIEAHLGKVDLVSNTSYFDRSSFGNNDYTYIQAAGTTAKSPAHIASSYLTPATSYFQSTVDQGNTQKNWSEELRLQSADPDVVFNWVLGAYFSKDKQSALQRTVIPTFETFYQQVVGRPFTTDPGWTGRGLLPGGVYLYSLVNAEDRQSAGFANVDLKVTSKLKLTGGVRYAHTSFNYNAFYDGPANGPVAYNDAGRQSENPVTPKGGISYQATDNFLVYANAAKGYRQGGAQQRNPTNCLAELRSLGYDTPPTTFKSDSVWSYELGSKGRLFGGKLQYDASVYRIYFNNVQRSIGLSSCARAFVANAGNQINQGFDLALTTLPFTGMSLGINVGYTNAHLRDNLLSGANSAGVRRVLIGEGDSLVPYQWSGSVNSEYGLPAFGDYEAYVRGDYTYQGHQLPGTVQNPLTNVYDPTLYTLPGYGLLNMRIGVRESTLDLSFFVQNLTNAHPLTSRTRYLTTNSLYQDATVPPRQIGVTAQVKF